jgi:hypothetical protein
MSSWYHSPERIERLVTEARKWLGTPFMTNGKSCGEAVDCHNLVYALHRATGAWPEFEVPHGRSGIAGQIQVRRMSEFFAQKPFMALVEEGDPLPGDILTGIVRGVEAHMIVFLGTVDGQPQTCITALHGGVSFVNLLDPTWAERRNAIWRTLHEDER